MLEIKDLTVSVEDKIILDNFSLKINQGEVHAIMGPNGSGKSTLSNVLCGKDNYKIKKGEIIFKEKNIFELSIDERAKLGLFLAFQYPVELPGVSITPFLKTAINSKLKSLGKKETDSGLDIDALKTVSKGVNRLKRKDNSIVVITHYQRLLDYIIPDFVHILVAGKIVRSGDKNLALELEKKGYENII